MKKFITILLVVFLLIGIAACAPDKGDGFTSGGRFIVVENNDAGLEISNYVLEDSETGVLYLLVYRGARMALTVLLNSDGTPMTMEGYKK